VSKYLASRETLSSNEKNASGVERYLNKRGWLLIS
jgi:hypothetical protein